ncbi:putative B3 domain-containing protein [Sesamum alatum]|uniref:B3 domain-containing protein n=1 Tax=Sesamum alatum TaxID=300844 RepID=A0AAE1XQN6_9LAMI|nr:putative B3 domain-containing protein [Sesamum alatum]
MGKNSEEMMITSFYKFLIDDNFTSQIRLPPQFVKDYGKNLSGKAKLHTESGDGWIVRIEQVGQQHFFTDGWTKFAQDADLKFREFLLFKFVGESTFQVSVYGISGCQKELHSCPRTHQQPDYDNLRADDRVPKTKDFNMTAERDDEFDKDDRQKWSFIKKLTKNNASELEIPRDFVLGTGILRNRKLTLVNAKGKKWPVHVTAKRCSRFAMTAGWNEFLTGNRVVVGSTISFELVSSSDNMVEAKMLKEETDGELFSYAKKKRGRPPILHTS